MAEIDWLGAHKVWVVSDAREAENVADFLQQETGRRVQYITAEVDLRNQLGIMKGLEEGNLDLVVVTSLMAGLFL